MNDPVYIRIYTHLCCSYYILFALIYIYLSGAKILAGAAQKQKCYSLEPFVPFEVADNEEHEKFEQKLRTVHVCGKTPTLEEYKNVSLFTKDTPIIKMNIILPTYHEYFRSLPTRTCTFHSIV